MSWSLLANELVNQIKCQCYAVDLRAHGDTYTTDDEDLSIDSMAKYSYNSYYYFYILKKNIYLKVILNYWLRNYGKIKMNVHPLF